MNGAYELATDLTGTPHPDVEERRCHCTPLHAAAECPDHGVAAFLRELASHGAPAADPERHAEAWNDHLGGVR